MAHTIPERMIDFDPASREDVIFKALKDGLGDDYWVFHSLSVNQTSSNGVFYEKEIDFAVYHREKGVLCIEAKNGAGISYSGGEWRYTGGRPMPHRGPFKQVQLERVSVCNLLSRRGEETAVLEGDGRFRDIAGRCKVVWGVWFHGMSRTGVDALDLPPEAPRDRILTMDDLAPERIQTGIDRLFETEVPGGVQTDLSDADVDWLISKVLSPTIANMCPSAKDGTRFSDIVYSQLIREQSRVLDFLEGQRSAVVNGMAGTGKTFVALERMRRCALRGEHTLYLCFNTALRDFLETDFALSNPDCASMVDFMTLDDFVGTLSRPLPPDLRKLGRDAVRRLQAERYGQAAERLLDSLGRFAYTQVVVDEGQDCAIPFIEQSGFMETLRDVVVAQENPVGRTSAFFMFYDAFQIVSLDAGTKAELPAVIRDADCKLTLYKNCRNTSSIAMAAARGVLLKDRQPEMAAGALMGNAPVVYFVRPDASPDTFASAVTHIIAELRKDYRADEIVLLSCAPGGTGKSRLEGKVKVKPGTDDRVFNQVYRFSTYRKFKGLDAAAVILVDVGRNAFVGPHGAMPFYEGASRARQRLVVFADMDDGDCREVVKVFENAPARKDASGQALLAELFKMSVGEAV